MGFSASCFNFSKLVLSPVVLIEAPGWSRTNLNKGITSRIPCLQTIAIAHNSTHRTFLLHLNQTPIMLFLLLLWVLTPVMAIFSSAGCYAQSDIQLLLSLQGDYLYQSTSYCQQLCDKYYIAALINGKSCYCGLTLPLADSKQDDSNCNTPCQGYGLLNCGGSNYFQVYVNGGVTGSSQVLSSSSAASSSASSSSNQGSLSLQNSQSSSASSSSPLSSVKSATSSARGSSSGKTQGSVTTFVSTTTQAGSGSNSVIEVTTTVGGSSSVISPTSSSSSLSQPSLSKKMSGGAIAGAAVGSIAGVALIAAGIIFLLWKRRRDNDNEEEDFFDMGDKDARMRGFDSVIPNTYTGNADAIESSAGNHTHSASDTSNSYSTHPDAFHYSEQRDEFADPREEDFGRRRLSDGSLPDMVAKGPGSLKVVNR